MAVVCGFTILATPSGIGYPNTLTPTKYIAIVSKNLVAMEEMVVSRQGVKK